VVRAPRTLGWRTRANVLQRCNRHESGGFSDRYREFHLRAAPALVPSAVEEVLRYRSPAQAMLRKARRPVALGDHEIPEGSLVFAMIGAANRDPARFAEPDRFDVAREPNPHLAFGHGPHFCLGAPLSRLEGRIALADLVERLHDVALASDEPWPPRRPFHVHGPSRLPIRFRPAPRS